MTTVPALPSEGHACPPCGISYPALTITEALDIVARTPTLVRAAVAAIPPIQRRTRAPSGRWSVVEYAAHLRDVYVTYTIRLHRTRTEHRPVLEPMLNDLRARRFRYNDLDLTAVLTELSHNVEGLREEAARVTAEDWARTATRLPGETRSALWLLRQAAHEGRHHTLDIRSIGAAQPDL